MGCPSGVRGGLPDQWGPQNRKVRNDNRVKNGSSKDEERRDKYISLSRRVTNEQMYDYNGNWIWEKAGREDAKEDGGGFYMINKWGSSCAPCAPGFYHIPSIVFFCRLDPLSFYELCCTRFL